MGGCPKNGAPVHKVHGGVTVSDWLATTVLRYRSRELCPAALYWQFRLLPLVLQLTVSVVSLLAAELPTALYASKR